MFHLKLRIFINTETYALVSISQWILISSESKFNVIDQISVQSKYDILSRMLNLERIDWHLLIYLFLY